MHGRFNLYDETCTCSNCHKLKPLSDFNINKYGEPQGNCKECAKEASRLWRIEHPECNETWKEHRRDFRIENVHRLWAMGTIRSHNNSKKGYTILLSVVVLTELAKNTRICYYCGCELDWTPLKGKLNMNSPTLDRRNNEKEIRLDNINIICTLCNTTKQDRTEKEFIEYCKRIALMGK